MVLAGGVAAILTTSPAWAGEAEDLAAGIKCKDAKGVIKMTQKFDKLKPAKKDTVSAIPEMRIITQDGGALPKRLFFRTDKQESDFSVASDGRVTDFARIRTMDKNGEMCLQSPAYIGQADGKSGVGMSLDFNVLYKNSSGQHTLAELLDGARDGESHYKKLFPGPLAIMVPKMTHVGIEYPGREPAQIKAMLSTIGSQIYATKAGKKVSGLNIETFGGMYVVALEDIKDLGADGLAVKGGAYTMTPIPSIEKMKKLGFEEDEEPAKDKPTKK